jgi:hypothetical protein
MSPFRLSIITFALAAAAFPAVANDTDAKSAPKAVATPEKDGERHEPAVGTQQYKMKVCAGEAHEKGLKGDERRAFMSNCLRKQ